MYSPNRNCIVDISASYFWWHIIFCWSKCTFWSLYSMSWSKMSHGREGVNFELYFAQENHAVQQWPSGNLKIGLHAKNTVFVHFWIHFLTILTEQHKFISDEPALQYLRLHGPSKRHSFKIPHPTFSKSWQSG